MSEILKIDNIAYGGEGVGRLADGRACFVRGALPGETVEIGIIAEKKRFARAELKAIQQPAAERIEPECPYFKDCPGCAYLHCTYETELLWKQKQFIRFLSPFLPEERIRAPFGSPKRFHWRNRLKLAVTGGIPGYRGFDNRTLVPVRQCLLANKEINRILETQTPPENREWFLRSTPSWCGCADAPGAPELLTDALPGAGEFQVGVKGFFQTNPEVASEMVRRVTELLKSLSPVSLLELYCGVGIFSIAAAEALPALRTCGVETDKTAIRCAALNASAHGVQTRCHFAAGDAAEAFKLFPHRRFDAAVVDPPRAGMTNSMVKLLLSARIPYLVYVSCAPDTLQRDLHLLSSVYQIQESGLLDMFPGTAHFESVTVLKIKDGVGISFSQGNNRR